MSSLDRPRNDLAYRLASFMSGNSTHFMFQHKTTFEPSIAISLYICFLTKKYSSPNTIRKALNGLQYLFTFAAEIHFDIERCLLTGDPIPRTIIRSFANWLSPHFTEEDPDTSIISAGYHNDLLLQCKQASHWFMNQFGKFDTGSPIEQKMQAHAAILADEQDWKMATRKVSKNPIAPDLSDSEISSIEAYLIPDNRAETGSSAAICHRDYLMWRLAIELGLRVGEILALRLQDCPSKFRPYLRIIRVEERGLDYIDPRGVYAPRPKTLSRDLGFIIENSSLPQLINTYVSRYRLVPEKKHGRKTGRKIMPSHEFLIIDQTNGNPLSTSSMRGLAPKISLKAGVPSFHWHLARHAFFNRAYLAAAADEQSATRLKDLVQFGGWSNAESLDIYSRRARRDRAREALNIWQDGATFWSRPIPDSNKT